jgi:FkbM family methyltransferase
MTARILILQENGRHDSNREFRECFSLRRAFNMLNVTVDVWGKGHENFSTPFNEIVRSYDAIVSLENYDSGWHPDLSTVDVPKAFWCIDAHMGVDRYVEFCKKHKFDIVYNSTSQFVDAFKGIAGESEWLPNAYDHILIDKLSHIAKTVRLGFCGNIGNRSRYINYLKSNYQLHHDRMVLGFDMVRAINSYQLHWNLNVSVDTNYRTFETLGCGTLLLTNYSQDLEHLFDVDRHLLCYRNWEEMEKKIVDLINNYEDYKSIASAGYLHVRKNHTYLNRAQMILEGFGFNENEKRSRNEINRRENKMVYYSQYGEELVLWRYFKNKRRGFLIDVGAADGVRYSNSRYLLSNFSWGGILIEPHPEFRKKLHYLYDENDNIRICNYAVAKENMKRPFYMYGMDKHAQVSTVSDDFRKRVINKHGDKYLSPIDVETMPLKRLLIEYECPNEIDFMSIDTEGLDMEVLQSMDWKRFDVNLVCIEHSMGKNTLNDFMDTIGYSFYDETAGNSFYAKET